LIVVSGFRQEGELMVSQEERAQQEETRARQEQEERRHQYEAELEPRVAAAASEVVDANRVLLGRVTELVPSRTADSHRLSADDQLWLQALGAVAHRYHLTYELITDNSGGTLWLIPPPGAPD
jgi:hypothetical protein